MKKIMLTAAFTMWVGLVFAQNEVVDGQGDAAIKMHRVALGETVVLIAKKYRVTPKDIYDLNPEAVDGISANQSLKIPMDKSIPAGEPEQHKIPVISRPAANKQGTASANALSEGVAATRQDIPSENKPVAGEVKTLPAGEEATVPGLFTEAERALPALAVTHVVKGGETLTALARKYNTTIARITDENSSTLRRGLKIGQKLTITRGSADQPTPHEPDTTPETAPGILTQAEIMQTTPELVEHHVLAGETLHSLARRYHTTVDAIISQNKKILRRGLQTGQTLHISSGHSGQ